MKTLGKLDRRFMAVTIALVLVAMVSGTAVAVDVGDLLKIFGIGYVVKQFSGQIDSFINKALGERGAEARGATKVVPILSVGAGGFIGAAQVVGVPSKVRTVKAVAQVEAKFRDRFRMRVLIPVSTETVSGAPKGVSGVGVSAVLDFEI
ncbi:MAG: hypothetical protein JSV65_07180 [Armatimonadota bacterium]|nr:MAG: hypothetical protein JSV65_07180 [Armatimonadota bacterium]